MSVDPLADLYYPYSPYSYVLNRPLNAVDPDGRLVIFINEFDGGDRSLRGNRSYWGRFARGVERHFGEDPNKSIFIHGGVAVTRGERKLMGYWDGMNRADAILDQITDSEGNVTETIKIITHSMGGAYGKGFVLALLKAAKRRGIKGVPITLVADFDPFQAGGMNAIDNVFTQQFTQKRGKGKRNNKLLGDWSGLANHEQDSAEEYYDDETNGSHNISTFLNDISGLREGTYIWNGENWVLQDDNKQNRNE